MRACRSIRLEGPAAHTAGSGPGPDPSSHARQPLRVVMVYREALLLTYVWQITAFFQRVCPTLLPVWEYWSYADIARPPELAAVSEAVRTAKWVTFCQATADALPPHVHCWVESWPNLDHEAPASVAFFSITEVEPGSEGKAQAYLRKMTRKAHRGFVSVRDLL